MCSFNALIQFHHFFLATAVRQTRKPIGHVFSLLLAHPSHNPHQEQDKTKKVSLSGWFCYYFYFLFFIFDCIKLATCERAVTKFNVRLWASEGRKERKNSLSESNGTAKKWKRERKLFRRRRRRRRRRRIPSIDYITHKSCMFVWLGGSWIDSWTKGGEGGRTVKSSFFFFFLIFFMVDALHFMCPLQRSNTLW